MSDDTVADLTARLNSVRLTAADLAVRAKRNDAGALEVVVSFRCAPDTEDLVQLFRLGRMPGALLVAITGAQFEMMR